MNSPHLFLFDECYKGRPLNFNWLAGPVIIVIIITNIIVTIIITIIITRQGLDGIAGRRENPLLVTMTARIRLLGIVFIPIFHHEE